MRALIEQYEQQQVSYSQYVRIRSELVDEWCGLTTGANPQALDITQPMDIHHHESVTPAPKDLLQSLASFGTLQTLQDAQTGRGSEALLDLLSRAAPGLPQQEEAAQPLHPSRRFFQPWILVLTCLLIAVGGYVLWSALTR